MVHKTNSVSTQIESTSSVMDWGMANMCLVRIQNSEAESAINWSSIIVHTMFLHASRFLKKAYWGSSCTSHDENDQYTKVEDGEYTTTSYIKTTAVTTTKLGPAILVHFAHPAACPHRSVSLHQSVLFCYSKYFYVTRSLAFSSNLYWCYSANCQRCCL